MNIINPHSTDKDRAQKQYVLNVLLAGSILVTALFAISAWIGEIQASPAEKTPYLGQALEVTLICLAFVVGLYLSKRGKSRSIAYGVIFLFLITSLFSSYYFGVNAPQMLLADALIIVMSGILINARFAVILSASVSMILLLLTYLQEQKIIIIQDAWKSHPSTLRDTFLYSLTLFAIAGISWLFNRELEKALQRARSSEQDLLVHNQQLEKLVNKRTEQLQISQAEKLSQISNFAEFGKLASGLFHDLANPLTIVSLSLQQLNHTKGLKNAEDALKEAIDGTEKVEEFLIAARKQIQDQPTLGRFSIYHETKAVCRIMDYRSRQTSVKIINSVPKNLTIYGNLLKFNQLMANLVRNAIDSYDNIDRTNKIIMINGKSAVKDIIITVRDFGSGIDPKQLKQIFKPLFTTKTPDKGTGLGLSITKEIVEKDFSGTIGVKSSLGKGSVFLIKLKQLAIAN